MVDLDERGFARTAGILDSEECQDLAALWEEGNFRSRVEMARHGFGEGEYKYFENPLPEAVNELRRRPLSASGRGREPLGGCSADDERPAELEELEKRYHAPGSPSPRP